MNNEFKKIKNNEDTRYVLENASSGGTSSGSVASVSMPIGSTRKRGDNILAQEADKKTVPVSTPRNFVAKNAKTGGAGQHKDKKKAEKQGDVKHRKPFAEQGVAEAAAPVTHRIGLTVTDPNHPMVSKRGETYQKSVRVTGPDREAAINQAIAHHRRKGYKVHDHHYLGTVDQGVAEALDSNFVGFMNKTLGQTADAPTDKSPMPDFMKGAPVAGLDSMGYRAALDFGMKTLRKLTPTQKTKLSIKGEDGVVNWLANQAKKQGLLITDESDEDTQGKFMQEDLDEVQDFLPEVFHDPAIKSWAFVLTDGEPLPKAPVAGPFKVGINPGITGQNGYANADWKTVDTLENLPDARDLAQGLSQKNPKQFVAIWAANGKSAGFYWPGEGWRGIDEGVAEGKKENKHDLIPVKLLKRNVPYWLTYDFYGHGGEMVKLSGPHPTNNNYIIVKDQDGNKYNVSKNAVLFTSDPTQNKGDHQGVAEGSEQEYKIYFVIPEHEDYPDRHEPTEQTIVLANSPGEAARKFKAETPEAYIKDIIPLGQQGVAEGFNGEYDDEAGMAHTNLLTSARAVMGLLKTINDKDNLPEWVQEKIAKAEMMLVGVWDYLQSQKEQGIDPQQGVAEGDAGLSKDAETNFHAKLDQLVHATFGKRKSEQGMEEGNFNEIKKGAKDSNGFTKCWPGKHAVGTKKGKKGGKTVPNCVPKESVDPYFESLRARVEELAKK